MQKIVDLMTRENPRHSSHAAEAAAMGTEMPGDADLHPQGTDMANYVEPPVRVSVAAEVSQIVDKLEDYEAELCARREQLDREIKEYDRLIDEARALLRHLKPTQKCVDEYVKQSDSDTVVDIAASVSPEEVG